MNKQFFKKAFVWGFVLWLIGYILGIILFMILPANLIGWVITPIGVTITLWVLFKKFKLESIEQYIVLSIIWTFMAIILDYVFLVKLFNPSDGYYKLDVYLYYILTFALPITVGLSRKKVK